VLDTLKEAHFEIPKRTIVTYRNNLNKLLGTPYSRDTWEIAVRRDENDVIYLGVCKLPQQISEIQKKTMYWGRKFEQACTPGNEHTPHQFCTIVKSYLNDNRIIMGAEIDCYEDRLVHDNRGAKRDHEGDSKKSKALLSSIQPLSSYVELKTYKLLDSRSAENSFQRYKTLSFWIQSFLAGVPVIVCGFRDDFGILRKVCRYATGDLPRLANHKWDKYECLNFAAQVIDGLWQHTLPGRTYLLQYAQEYVVLLEK